MERKIIEIYADEKKDEGIITFDFRKVDDTEVSNALMKKLLIELSDEYEVEKVVEKMDIEELKKLFYSDNLTQTGKRKLINYYEKRIAELEEEIKKEKLEKLIQEMRENGSQYWANRLEKLKEKEEEKAMDFGEAIKKVKEGKQVQREGWNGKGQYIELATNISYVNTKKEVINAEHEAIGNKAIAFVGTSGVQLGWLASQADMLAEDWKIKEEGNICTK